VIYIFHLKILTNAFWAPIIALKELDAKIRFFILDDLPSFFLPSIKRLAVSHVFQNVPPAFILAQILWMANKFAKIWTNANPPILLVATLGQNV
jgi:hypothetical protein